MTWNAGGPTITSYPIERSTDDFKDPANVTVVRTVGPATRALADSGLNSNTPYSYRVVALNRNSSGSAP